MPKLANPYHFQKFTQTILPILSTLTIAGLISGLIYALILSPPDYQQGNTVRIMYIHVPAAYNALAAYSLMAITSAIYLVWKHPLAHTIAQACALPGIICTAICLITGALWGKPIWGTWWAWDARMTSVLILFFLYLGYLSLNQNRQGEPTQKAAAVLAVIGAINLPIIKFSVDWWHSLHQPASLIRWGGPTMHADMLTPLLIMLAAGQLWLALMIILNAKTNLNRQKLQRRNYART